MKKKFNKSLKNIFNFMPVSCAMLISAVALALSQYYLVNSYDLLSETTQQRQIAEASELKSQKLNELNAQTEKLLQEVKEIGLNPGQWTELTTNIRRSKTSRDAANNLLAQIRRKPDHYFRIDKFEISVEEPEQSLFSSVHARSDVLVTLQGRSLMRSGHTK